MFASISDELMMLQEVKRKRACLCTPHIITADIAMEY